MKKLFLGILAFMVISSLSFVSAGDINITIYMEGEIVSPPDGSYVRGDVLISWDGNFEVGWLKYKEGTCDGTSSGEILAYQITGEGNYIWNTNTPDTLDGKYCIKITGTDQIFENITVTIDNTPPVIDNFVVNYNGKERDRPPVNDTEKTSVYLHASETNLYSCIINWADGSSTTDCSSNMDKSYKHQYEDNKIGGYNVVVTVKDLAGNTATDSVVVSVANVVPTIVNQINGPTEVATNQVATFNAQADDVYADLEAGLTCNWKFDNSVSKVTTANNTGYCSVEYTWDSASVHTVDLCVKDKDNGQNCSFTQYLVNVEEPEHMTPMQKVVQGNEFQFDLDEAWAVTNKKRFKTSFTDPVTCTAIVAPNDMNIFQNGPNNRCEVTWTPTNAQRGEHKVIIRVNDSTEHKYYSFDVTVYSWGIELSEGWNLISIPYMPTNPSINSVFGGIIENVAYEDTNIATVLMYNAVTTKWYKAKPTPTHSKFTYVTGQLDVELKSIVPGYGYWIKMENEDWIYGIEDNFGVSFIPGQAGIDLATASWNLIGRYGSNVVDSNYTTALKSLRIPFYMDNYVSAFLGIYKLDNVTINGDAIWSPTTMIYPVQGYWVRTAAGSEGRETIRYEPSTL